jgi:hypothetical protein
VEHSLPQSAYRQIRGIVRIKRKTRIAIHIEERLLVRTRQSGEIAPVSGPPHDGLPGGPVSKSEKEKDVPSCKDE